MWTRLTSCGFGARRGAKASWRRRLRRRRCRSSCPSTMRPDTFRKRLPACSCRRTCPRWRSFASTTARRTTLRPCWTSGKAAIRGFACWNSRVKAPASRAMRAWTRLGATTSSSSTPTTGCRPARRSVRAARRPARTISTCSCATRRTCPKWAKRRRQMSRSSETCSRGSASSGRMRSVRTSTFSRACVRGPSCSGGNSSRSRSCASPRWNARKISR